MQKLFKFWETDLIFFILYIAICYWVTSNLFEWGGFGYIAFLCMLFLGPTSIYIFRDIEDTDTDRLRGGKALSVSLLFFIPMLFALSFAGKAFLYIFRDGGTLDNARIELQEEIKFRNEVKFEHNVQLYYNPSIMGGFVSLTNNTTYNWESIYIILNPNVESTGDAIAFKLGVEDGFRAPGDNEKVYTHLAAGESLNIPLSDFMQTKTGEVYSSDRYRLRKAYVKAVIRHNGKPVSFDCILTFNL